MSLLLHQFFRFTHGKPFQHNFIGQQYLLCALQRQQSTRVPHIQLVFHQHALHDLRQFEQSQQVAGGAARTPYRLCCDMVSHLEFVDQALDAHGFFQRIQVFTLDILDQRHRQRRIVRHAAHQHRHMGQPRQLCGAPAPLAGDDFIAAVGKLAHQDRLHDSLRLD